jgi:zinc/manganese transport system permease protein
MMSWLLEPGFFASPQVRIALLIGAVAAVVSGVVGVFTVLRGQSFGGHALTDASATGGSAMTLLPLNPLIGFILGAVAGAGAMEAVGVRHRRGRDLATGMVLGASIGLASLFLYLATTQTSTTGAPQVILFGSIFTVVPGTTAISLGFGGAALVIIGIIYRPLILSSVDSEMAAARGVPIRAVGFAYMLALAFAVGLSSVAIGAILSTALLIGPPATALRLAKQLPWVLTLAVLIGVGSTWLGILFAYDSADWFGGQGHGGLPVSFFIVAVVFAVYLLSGLRHMYRHTRPQVSPTSEKAMG